MKIRNNLEYSNAVDRVEFLLHLNEEEGLTIVELEELKYLASAVSKYEDEHCNIK